MRRFILKSTILTAIVFTLGAIIYSTVLNQFYRQILPVFVLIFYVVTNLVHAYLLKIAGKSNSKFSSQYMAASFLKMFLYLAIAIVFVIFNKENAKIFIANYLLLYILYTGFEVYEFAKVVKQESK